MNLFYLHEDPIEISEMMCDKHNVKMILESAQMLSTAHRVCDGDDYADNCGLYKSTHINHPTTKWTRENGNNYYFHFDLFKAMLGEYMFRYGKVHKCTALMYPLEVTPQNIPVAPFTEPPQCMPDKYKSDSTVQAYRDYYIGEKAGFAKWKAREVPTWFHSAN